MKTISYQGTEELPEKIFDGWSWRGTSKHGQIIIHASDMPGFWHACKIEIGGVDSDSIKYANRKTLPHELGKIGFESIALIEWEPTTFRHPSYGDVVYPEPGKTNDSFIYFLRAGDFVKIGFASSPRRRMSEIQACCPLELELEVFTPGTIQTEFSLHRRFSKFRVRPNGEWFHRHGVASYIESLKAEESRQ